MAERKFKPGDLVALKVRTMGGWKGIGTVIDVSHDGLRIAKEGDPDRTCDVLKHEVRKVRAYTHAYKQQTGAYGGTFPIGTDPAKL